MLLVNALYPNTAGSRFDHDYYAGHHAALAATRLGDALVSMRVLRGVESVDGTAPAFHVVAEMRFASREAFDTVMAAHGAELTADVARFTDITPTMQIAVLLTERTGTAN